MALVTVENLVKRYTPDGPNAVDDVSFEIQGGEIFFAGMNEKGPRGAEA